MVRGAAHVGLDVFASCRQQRDPAASEAEIEKERAKPGAGRCRAGFRPTPAVALVEPASLHGTHAGEMRTWARAQVELRALDAFGDGHGSLTKAAVPAFDLEASQELKVDLGSTFRVESPSPPKEAAHAEIPS